MTIGVSTQATLRLQNALGKEILQVLNDPSVIEVMLNPDGNFWVERLGHEPEIFCEITSEKAMTILNSVAGFHGRIVNFENPYLECEWPLDGSRFSGQTPPIVHAPTFSLRKHASKIITLDEYLNSGAVSLVHYDQIISSINERKNILVIGGTSSGKTTLVNAILDSISKLRPDDRLLIFEDTKELQVSSRNKINYSTTASIRMHDLLKISLRMNPTTIVIGEVRGPEALDLLMTWNTGHEGGTATIHASSAYDALNRLKMLVSQNLTSPREIEPLIGAAVHLLVFIKKINGKRKICELIKVDGFKNGNYLLTDIRG